MKRLNTKSISKLAQGRYRDSEARGLYLQVSPTGTKSWILRFELNGRERFMGLGAPTLQTEGSQRTRQSSKAKTSRRC